MFLMPEGGSVVGINIAVELIVATLTVALSGVSVYVGMRIALSENTQQIAFLKETILDLKAKLVLLEERHNRLVERFMHSSIHTTE